MQSISSSDLTELSNSNVENIYLIGVNAVIRRMEAEDEDYSEQGKLMMACFKEINDSLGYEAARYKAAPREDFFPRNWAMKISETETRPVWLVIEDLS